MNFFTPELYLAQQVFDTTAMDAADATWDEAVQRYDAYLQGIRPQLSESVRQLLDGFYLHDAKVLSMGRRGETFVIVLQLDTPPHEVLTVTYHLAGKPEFKPDVLPAEHRSSQPAWLFEELKLISEGDRPGFEHRILFSNGWEVRLPFDDVRMTTVHPLFPVWGTAGVSANLASAPSA